MIVVAALAPWHEAHRPARAALAGKDVRLPAHAAIETVSSLSRMPEQKRIAAELVLEALRRDFPKRWLALSAKGPAGVPRKGGGERCAGWGAV